MLYDRFAVVYQYDSVPLSIATHIEIQYYPYHLFVTGGDLLFVFYTTSNISSGLIISEV